jgi:hypothetical protein
MGKGSALLLLLGVGGLLLALPRALHDRSVASQHRVSPAADPRAGEGGGLVGAKSKARRVPPRADPSAELVSALLSPDNGEQQQAIELLLPEMMKRDIAATAAMVADLEEWAPLREIALMRVSREWGRSDPHAALRWAKELPVREQQSHCTLMICRAVAESDAELSVRLAEDAGKLLDLAALSELVAGWILASPAPAGAWIAHRSPDERDQFWNLGVQALAESSPEKAAILAVEHMSPGFHQDEAVISALHQWVLRDREAAAAWVAQFPEGPLRDRAEGELSATH